MNTVLQALLISAAILVPDAGNANDPAAFVFVRPDCPYTVQFPAMPVRSETPQQDGTETATAEFVAPGIRLSAFCSVSAQPTSQIGTEDIAQRHRRIVAMADALGMSTYDMHDIDIRFPNCSEVIGSLRANGTTYHIVSRLCFDGSSTFIGEAVYASDADAATVMNFMRSLARNPQPEKQPLIP